MRILVTGGCGFIGSNYVLHRLRASGDDVVNIDKLTEVSNRANLAEVESDSRYRFIEGDIVDRGAVRSAIEGADAVIHFAAESHVDRSIEDATGFYRTNVEGTLVLLEEALRAGVGRFVHISTDEVYGSLGAEGTFHEGLPLLPNSPYAASKGSADLLVRSFVKTHGLHAVITRCCNNYGPFQFPEKLIPLMVIRALGDRLLPVYGDGMNVRDWIHVEDHCRAVDMVLEKGTPAEAYNVGSQSEMTNLDIVRTLLKHLGKPESLIRYVQDRPGHDWRYAIDPAKLEGETGWKPIRSIEEGIESTVRWYVDHRDWWETIMARPTWSRYFSAMYDDRLANASKTPPKR